MKPFHITGAQVLRPGGLDDAPLGIAGARIADELPGRAVDLTGWLVLPGIVDIHGDGFERHLAPRRGAMSDLASGLIATEAELAANGITTAVLAQFWSWEGGMRGPDFALAMLDALDRVRGGFGTDLLCQLRLETHLIDDYRRFEEAVARHRVPYVVFNDHLPHAALNAGRKVPRLTGQALKSGRSPEAHLALLEALHARDPEVPDAVTALAARLAGQGVRTGSHDDPDAETRRLWRGRGVTLSEFPETPDAAAEAAGAGEPVVMGAPNVMRGGSHAGKVAAEDIVRSGHCTALASDYHYPAPRLAALKLAESLGLGAAWRLVSSGPAEVLGLIDRGHLSPGARADLVILHPGTGRVGATIAGGEVRYMSGEVARAFIG
ncbi:phosphonate metabolism protein PhnM [Oceanicola sp. 22II-s10i]|uniref:alpha-D-ribose 1-methylphosphonate 5-triphosphate diphosphatase n=1 Tax=Oceanicola sp. 22II-s10i TaxID=1317116 RepID=UPI000B5209E1|nr:alpha-D-ribose 1-methylphosphonate 5-triphosphate diphosphatase [Oceanicola sp. 22II-s10i]OWU84121.1 phosphonate metabolism protein PhnM [Oceanicola sp. 22II-s10i]